MSDVVHAQSAERRRELQGALAALAATRGYYWAHARAWYQLHAHGDHHNQTLDEQKLADIISGNGYFHSLQVCFF